MKTLLAFLILGGSAFAGQARVQEQSVLNKAPACAQSRVTYRPAPVVVQQRVVMVPQVQTVQVERVITEYVPQQRVERVEQQVTVLVPQVQEDCCVPQAEYVPQTEYVPQVDYSIPQPQYRSLGVTSLNMTDKERSVYYMQNSIDDMELSGKRPGQIRRARRELARMERVVKNERRRGGY